VKILAKDCKAGVQFSIGAMEYFVFIITFNSFSPGLLVKTARDVANSQIQRRD
jgi:hypothetical protein